MFCYWLYLFMYLIEMLASARNKSKAKFTNNNYCSVLAHIVSDILVIY